MLCVQFLFWYIAYNWNHRILAIPARTIVKTHLNILPQEPNTPTMNTVTLGVKINNIPVHAVLDSGAGCSVIDLGSVEKLSLSQNIIQANHKLIDASGNTMDIIGSITTVVNFNRMRPINHEFKVLNSKTYTNILFGRDLMKMYRTVTFNFSNNRVQLGRVWQNGLTINGKEQAHIQETVTIPARSEQTVLVRCTKKAAMLSVDFEPGQKKKKKKRARSSVGCEGTFSSRAWVTRILREFFKSP